MRYITREDLIEVIQGRLLDESVSELPEELLDGLDDLLLLGLRDPGIARYGDRAVGTLLSDR